MNETDNTASPKLPFYWFGIAGAAVLGFILLLVLPSTGPVVRTEIGMMFHSSRGTSHIVREMGAVNLTNGPSASNDGPIVTGDYDAALTNAVLAGLTQNNGGAAARSSRLHELLFRFPDHSIEVYAHLVRYATMGEVAIRRDAEVEKYINPTSQLRLNAGRVVSTPEAIEAFEDNARAGAKLDPDNAYFPTMLAIGLFAEHKDEAGLQALKEAGTRPRWDDYCWKEPEARWRNAQKMGGVTAVGRAAIVSSVLFPQYAQLRGMARLTNYLAVKKEVAGKPLEGLAIRHDTMLMGAKMRVQSKNYIGNLVGMAIESIAMGSPNREMYGGFDQKSWQALDADQRNLRRQEEYSRWTKSIGRPDEGEFAAREMLKCAAAKSVGKDLEDVGPISVPVLVQLSKSWTISMITLTNTLLMLTLTIVAIAMRLMRLDKGTAPLLVTGCILGLFIVLALGSQWAIDTSNLVKVMSNMSMSNGNGNEEDSMSLNTIVNSPTFVRTSVFVLSLLAPAMVLVCLGIGSAFKRNAEYSVLARGLQTAGAVISLLLIFGYGSSVSDTAKHEAALNHSIDLMSKHEARYLAELHHMQWPD